MRFRAVRKLRSIQRFSTTVRLILIKLLIGGLDLGRIVWKWTVRGLSPLVRLARGIIRTLLSGIILNSYFFLLKFRRRMKGLAERGSHRFVAWVNTYLARIAIIAVIAITVAFNLLSKPLNAEELNSKILFTDAINGQNQSGSQLIEEGPLLDASQQSQVTYIDADTVLSEDLLELPLAPGTDIDDVFATTEGDSAIIAPIITDPDAAAPTRTKIETYIVQEGDTIGGISQRLGVNVNTILWQNGLSWTSTIRPGLALSILPVDGVAHTIKSGDTVSALAKKYQVDASDIIEYNKLADASDIRPNEVLIIPDGIKPAVLAARPARSLPEVVRDIFAPPAVDSGTRLLWPLISHRITQYFTLRHKGVDVGDKKGNPVYAAESGRVERAGWNSGYGYNLIINHGNGIKTLYAHNSKLLVKAGDTVERGQNIALIGSTGWSTGPHLHFEVRVNGAVTNPLNYIR